MNSTQATKKQVISFKKLVVPVGMRSIYWKYFGFPGNEEGDILTREKIICTLCKIQMAYNGNTSNLRMHLQNKHAPYLLNLEATSPPYVPKSRTKIRNLKRSNDANAVVHSVAFDGAVELDPMQGNNSQPPVKFISLGEGNSSAEYLTPDSMGDTVTYYLPDESGAAPVRNDSHEMGDALLRFFTSELLSPGLIDGSGFQRLVEKLNPSVALPSSKQLEEEIIPQQYDELKNGIVSELESLSEFSLSIEEWLGINEQIFITISAHFLHEEQLITRTLPTVQWDENNSSLISKTFSHWGIEKDRLTAIVVSVTQPLLIEALEEWAPTFPCFLFTLQQAVAACFSLPEVESILCKCRATLAHFKLQQNFATEAENRELACYNIKSDYPKIWTSTYELLQEFVNNKSEIQSIIMENTLNDNDWNNLSTIVDVLSPFKVTVQTLQEENPALLSIIKPLLWQLITNYLQLKNEDNEFAHSLKLLLKSKLSNAYKNKMSNILLQIATTLDPRFKQLSYASEDEGDTVRQTIKTKLAKIIEQFGDAQSTNVTNPVTPQTQKKKISGMELLLGDLCSPVKQEFTRKDRAELELSHYTSESPVAFDENPLSWWHNSETKCPNLVRLAKRYTCVPACAIPAFRIPIRQRELFERQRATLCVDMVDKMVFLNGNLV